jgi:ubiquinone/menaquinone biosynthesis C-methylase UbiE
MPVVTVFDERALEYDQWFDAHDPVYRAELAAIQKFVPQTDMGIEVGVGTGRFAVPLGIRFGIDPSRRMLKISQQRGLRVCQAIGERLPFRDGQFDLVLLVTVICFVDDVPTLLRELHRVLAFGGRLVIGFINRNSELGRLYEFGKEASAFYREARFYAVEDVTEWMKETGFHALQYCQTLFGSPSEFPTKGLEVRDGASEGAFIVLGAGKT